MATGFSTRVLFVEDEAFLRNLLTEAMTSAGCEVRPCPTAAEALASLEGFDPHAIVTDLDLGPGPSGVDLLRQVAGERPWLGLVVLSAHANVELAVGDAGALPEGTAYVVKSSLGSAAELLDAVDSAIAHRATQLPLTNAGRVVLSPQQGEILRLIALGYSNAGIAAERGITRRAAEGLVQRTFEAMGLSTDPRYNIRVLATRMWQQGQVSVR